MLGDLGLVAIGALVGVIFSETIRAFARKVTKGAFFGSGTGGDTTAEK
jgi:hypothetical protein